MQLSAIPRTCCTNSRFLLNKHKQTTSWLVRLTDDTANSLFHLHSPRASLVLAPIGMPWECGKNKRLESVQQLLLLAL